jgi:hypothetical protein
MKTWRWIESRRRVHLRFTRPVWAWAQYAITCILRIHWSTCASTAFRPRLCARRKLYPSFSIPMTRSILVRASYNVSNVRLCCGNSCSIWGVSENQPETLDLVRHHCSRQYACGEGRLARPWLFFGRLVSGKSRPPAHTIRNLNRQVRLFVHQKSVECALIIDVRNKKRWQLWNTVILCW